MWSNKIIDDFKSLSLKYVLILFYIWNVIHINTTILNSLSKLAISYDIKKIILGHKGPDYKFPRADPAS